MGCYFKDLKDELETYKEDVKATERQLDDTSVQKRKLIEDVHKLQDQLSIEVNLSYCLFDFDMALVFVFECFFKYFSLF